LRGKSFSKMAQQAAKQRRICENYIETIARIFLIRLLPDYSRVQLEKGVKQLITALVLATGSMW
jgi:hypothetical protein